MVASDQSTVISSCIQGGTIQWMSPELIDPERFGLVESRPTKESDCYALGMVVYEVLSGQTPFAPSPLPPVIWKVLEGQRPGRPQGKGGALFTDDLWEVLGLCWKHKPDERTNAKVVLQCLERTSMLPRPSPDMDRIVEIDTDESLDAIVNDSGMFSQFRRSSQADLRSPLWCNRYNDYTWWRLAPSSSSSYGNNSPQYPRPTSKRLSCESRSPCGNRSSCKG